MNKLENAMPTPNFATLGLIEPILRAVKQMGYEQPTPIQQQSIPPILHGRDILGCAQTGTGKTAAFALPLLQKLALSQGRRGVRALVLTPTRELAAQIDESFRDYGANLNLGRALIFGGVGAEPQKRALERRPDILVATPGRLLDLMSQGFISLNQVEVFVLDEADRMLDMGFIHDVKRVIAKLPPARQNLLFSATMPPEVQSLVNAILKNPVHVAVAPTSSTSEQIDQSLYYVDRPNKRRLLIHVLENPEAARVIVFTRTKAVANRVSTYLNEHGIQAEAIHGNKSQNARLRALANFKSGATRVLVASDLAARGIDIDDITHVINYDVPNIPETYVHRIGRTGRAANVGAALSFCDAEERSFVTSIERVIKKKIPVVNDHPFPMDPNQAASKTPSPGPQRPQQRNNSKFKPRRRR